ncbi:MAG: hypothetical protein J0H67_03940 [Rhodospirillales bacterium]|nr:hypothetical protein [Rhodospirillales bacterium]
MSVDAETAGELVEAGVMDPVWYRARYPDVARFDLDPTMHYLHYGWREGRWPNRWFDTAWYLETNPEIAAAALNPLLHYFRSGDQEGRRPHPAFDPAWYRQAYELPAETLALAHFLTLRHTGRFAPSAELWPVPYLPGRTVAPGTDPYAAYLDATATEGQPVFPDYALVQLSGLLDVNYYLINGSDVHAADVDPCNHFCRFGWQEGRRPNIYFDPLWYTRTNPDVARLRINPLVHYIVVGEAADRRPVPYFEPIWYRTAHGVPDGELALAHFLTHRRRQQVSPNHLFDVRWYVAQHTEDLGPNRDAFAHYLQAGTFRDVDPSPGFDAGAYRRTHLGRPSRGFRRVMTPDEHNPLVHALRSGYPVQAVT